MHPVITATLAKAYREDLNTQAAGYRRRNSLRRTARAGRRRNSTPPT